MGKHKNMTFVFTSLLSTSFGWLNRAIGSFNTIMFELAATIPNLRFFDAHQVLMSRPISTSGSNIPVIRSDGDGIHITFAARKLVTTELVKGLDIIACHREGVPVSDHLHHWKWPLRPSYVCKLNRDWSKFGDSIVRGKG